MCPWWMTRQVTVHRILYFLPQFAAALSMLLIVFPFLLYTILHFLPHPKLRAIVPSRDLIILLVLYSQTKIRDNSWSSIYHLFILFWVQLLLQESHWLNIIRWYKPVEPCSFVEMHFLWSKWRNSLQVINFSHYCVDE